MLAIDIWMVIWRKKCLLILLNMRQLLFLTTLILNQVSHNSADFYETQMVLKKVHTVLVFVDLFV